MANDYFETVLSTLWLTKFKIYYMLLKILIIIIKIVVYCQNGVLQQQLVSDLDKTWCGLVLCFKTTKYYILEFVISWIPASIGN